jgi:fatty acid/phospholipid biosynthesis enzyme
MPSASPDLTASAMRTIELSFFLLMARTGSSSISIFSEQCLNSEADGCVSAGNTGALMSAGLFIVGRIKGVARNIT